MSVHRHAAPKPKFPARRDGIYYLEGEEYLSTTAILTALAKPALIPWAARKAAEAVFTDPEKYNTVEKAAAAVNFVKDSAADRGKALHERIGSWASTGIFPAADLADPYLSGFLSFARAWTPKPLFSECVVFSKTHKYAGRLDLIAQVGAETWLLDFKTSKGIWPENGLQLAAYKNAEFLKLPDGTIHAMPQVDKTGIVSIPGDGGFEFKLMDEPFKVFLALAEVYAWSKHRAG